MEEINFNAIRVLSLDLDDTLWPIMPAIDRADAATMAWFEQHAPRVAEHFDIPAMRALRADVAHRYPQFKHDLGILRRLCIRTALQQCGYHQGMAHGAWEVFYQHRMQVELYADALHLLERAAQSEGQVQLAAVSNGNADLNEIGIRHHFSVCIHAHEVAARKPEPAIWQQLIQQTGVAPEHILHVGDHPLEDTEGARQMGIQTIWLNRKEKNWPLNSHAPSHVPDLTPIVEALFC